jgi:tripartite-type tricarboxylate transporter receptor subunit TctC
MGIGKWVACAAMPWAMAFAGMAHAQDAAYPSRPIRMVVSFAAGGSTDVVARIIAQRMSQHYNGNSVLVDNRPGGGGVIGYQAVMQAAPDGYTLAFATSSLTNSPLLLEFGQKLVPVTMAVSGAYVLVTAPDLAANSVQELLALARQKPGSLNYASPGIGSTSHLVGELFKTRFGVDVTHVPYKGSTPALQDLVTGRVQIMFDAIPSSQAFIQSAKLKALAVAGPARSKALPNVPTTREAGLADFDPTYWSGILASPGTPKPVIDNLNVAVVGILKNPQVRDSLEGQGVSPVGDTPAEFANKIRAETELWRKLIETAKIKLVE